VRFDLRPIPAADIHKTLVHGWSFTVPLAIPAPTAFDLLADTDAWPRWYADMRSMAWVDAPGLGARRKVVTNTASLEEKFVIWEPGRRMAFHVLWMTIPLVSAFTEDFEVTPSETGCTLRWDVRYEARRPFRWLRPVLDPTFKRMFDRGVAALPAFAKSYA
jgi:hypothetical protein